VTTGVIWADLFRGAAIVLGVMALALFPGTVVHRIHGWRSWVVATVVVLLFASLIASTWRHLGHGHIVWYRSPVLFAASILALIYVVSVRGWRIWYDPDS
jgi:phosphatidylserine synthase